LNIGRAHGLLPEVGTLQKKHCSYGVPSNRYDGPGSLGEKFSNYLKNNPKNKTSKNHYDSLCDDDGRLDESYEISDAWINGMLFLGEANTDDESDEEGNENVKVTMMRSYLDDRFKVSDNQRKPKAKQKKDYNPRGQRAYCPKQPNNKYLRFEWFEM